MPSNFKSYYFDNDGQKVLDEVRIGCRLYTSLSVNLCRNPMLIATTKAGLIITLIGKSP